jgi:hypothetical protein
MRIWGSKVSVSRDFHESRLYPALAAAVDPVGSCVTPGGQSFLKLGLFRLSHVTDGIRDSWIMTEGVDCNRYNDTLLGRLKNKCAPCRGFRGSISKLRGRKCQQLYSDTPLAPPVL